MQNKIEILSAPATVCDCHKRSIGLIGEEPWEIELGFSIEGTDFPVWATHIVNIRDIIEGTILDKHERFI